MFLIAFLQIGSAAVVNGPVLFMERVEGAPKDKSQQLGEQILIDRNIVCDTKQISIHGWWYLGEGGESGSPWY